MKCVTVSFGVGSDVLWTPNFTMERDDKGTYFLSIGKQRVEFVRGRKAPYIKKYMITEALIETYHFKRGKFPRRLFGFVGCRSNPKDTRTMLLLRLPPIDSFDGSEGFFWEVFSGNPRVLVTEKDHLREGHVGKGTRMKGDALTVLRPGDAIHLSHQNYTNGGAVVYFSRESKEDCGIVIRTANEMQHAA